MRKNNLWITALAFGLSLSAYGQQAEGGISSGMLQEIKQAYKGTPADKAIHNAIAGNDINKLAVNNDSKNNFDTYFSHKVNSKGITNQKSSGRCWLFTGLNVIRAQVIANITSRNSNSRRTTTSSGTSLKKQTFSCKESLIHGKSRSTTKWWNGCSRIRSETADSLPVSPTT